MQTPEEDLRWNFLKKSLTAERKAVNYFRK